MCNSIYARRIKNHCPEVNNFSACKGACCWEGDWGAPLEESELATLEAICDEVKPYLSPAGIKVLEEEGLYKYYDEPKEHGTPLVDNGPCAYMTFDKNGVAKCGIEAAWADGKIDYKKPISCHLYPIRTSVNRRNGFERLLYDRWDICSATCKKGEELKVRVYQFAKDSIIRKYGEAFYEELDALAQHVNE